MTDEERMLQEYISHNIWLVRGTTKEEAIARMVSQMYCTGGDTTYLLISHFKDTLGSAIAKVLEEKHQT